MKRHFVNTDSEIFEIPRFRLIAGLIIGLFYSFVFYSFLYMLREVVRILSFTQEYDIWVLTDEEVNFYNLFFACISVVISQSVCFAFWLDKPRGFFDKRHYRTVTIVNDQRALNWYFLSWFSKLAIVFGLLFGLTIRRGYYVFSFYPDYSYVFILFTIVLFLQTWSATRLTFKRKSLKWMLLTGAILSLMALGLSKINLIDYKSLNQNILRKNVQLNYKLELPETNVCERLFSRSLIENIYVVKSKNRTENEPFIIADNREMDINELKDKIIEWKSMRSENEIQHVVYQLHIDKTIKMDFINQIKNIIAKYGGTRIAYAVVPNVKEYDIRFYKNFSFQSRIKNWHSDSYNPKDIYNDFTSFQNIIEIKQSISGECYVNNKLVENDKLKPTLRHLIRSDSDYAIIFHVNDSVDFSDYFSVVSLSREVITELREEYSTDKYNEQFKWLDSEKVEEIERRYPLRFFELPAKFGKL